MKTFFYLALFSLFALPAHAARATIVETDTEIIVEYYGNEDDRQAALKQREEQEQKLAEALEKEERQRASALRRAEARKSTEDE